jgi:opacity protein-like surface antigen
MKNIITAAVLVLAASVANAANLPEKKATPTAPAVTAPSSWYVGVNAGGNVSMNHSIADTPTTVGGVVGYKFNSMFAAEADVDYMQKKNGIPTQTRVTLNGVVSPFGSFFGFTPYALAGAGVQKHDVRVNNLEDGNKTIYQIGGGVKYAVTKDWEVDGRYRRVNNFDNTLKNSDIFTLGVNYKF